VLLISRLPIPPLRCFLFFLCDVRCSILDVHLFIFQSPSLPVSPSPILPRLSLCHYAMHHALCDPPYSFRLPHSQFRFCPLSPTFSFACPACPVGRNYRTGVRSEGNFSRELSALFPHPLRGVDPMAPTGRRPNSLLISDITIS
jgi:hypothetical protein